MKKLLKNAQFRIIAIVVTLLFIPGIFILKLGFDKSEEMLMESKARLISENLEQKKTEITDMIYATRKLSSIASTDKTIVSSLTELTKNPINLHTNNIYYTEDEWNNILKIQDFLRNYRNTFFDYQTHNLLYGVDGTTYSMLDGIDNEVLFGVNFIKSLNQQAWYADFMKSNDQSVWEAPCRYSSFGIFNDTGRKDTKNYLVFVRKIHNYLTQENLGVSIISLHTDNLRNILTVDDGCVMTMTSKNGSLIFSTDTTENDFGGSLITQQIVQSLPDGQKGYVHTDIEGVSYMVNYLVIQETGWKLIYTIPYQTVTAEITKLRNSTMALSLIIFMLSLIICISMIVYATNPINRLVERVKNMQIGGRTIGQGTRFSGDLSDVEKTFDDMFSQITLLVDDALKEQQLESQLRYETLRAQIKPHFLFNTLNSIKWSAMVSGAGNVADMIASLGTLLEASMSRGEDMIPLQREMELVKTYADIKNWTLKYRFSIDFFVPEELFNYKIIKFTLQPIVENAVIHGLEDREDGLISIQAYRADDVLIINVSDDGKGMTPEKIDEVLGMDAANNTTDEQHKFSGIGLTSINGMIRLKYGENFGLSIKSELDKGTTVTIKLPYCESN